MLRPYLLSVRVFRGDPTGATLRVIFIFSRFLCVFCRF